VILEPWFDRDPTTPVDPVQNLHEPREIQWCLWMAARPDDLRAAADRIERARNSQAFSPPPTGLTLARMLHSEI